MRVISCALSPNTDVEDVRVAWSTLFMPWDWLGKKAVRDVEIWFQKRYQVKTVETFTSGRAALWAILWSFGIGEGDDVIVQAFTCVAVSNSIRWAGATPVYVDIDTTLNVDPKDLNNHLTKRTKAIIVQHTFGVPADMKNIMRFARDNNLLVIEDCAHAIGATYNGKDVGTFGDAAFFSFGRDKAVSSVWGGAAIIHEKWKNQCAKLEHIHASLPTPSLWWVFQQLMHPIAFSVILPSYTYAVGKLLLVLLQKSHILSFPVDKKEYVGKKPDRFAMKYPDALAKLLLIQLAKLDTLTKTRRENAAYFKTHLPEVFKRCAVRSGSTYLRFAVTIPHPQQYILRAKKKGIVLGNWYHHVIDPGQVNLAAVGYTEGSCPHAESVARDILNLPTRIHRQESERVIEALIK